MIKIAITGNIASGKSCIEQILLDMGYKVVDTDKINHAILASDIVAIDMIKKAFQNDDILNDDFSLSREKLGKIVFTDNNKRNVLEKILHPIIKKQTEIFFEKNQNEKFVFVCAPVLFESGMDKDFDKIIFVYAPDNVRLERLVNRNNYSKEYALKRMIVQENQESKIQKSDFVIYNDSDFENLKNQTENIVSILSSL